LKNSATLTDGDSVKLIKDLKVGRSSTTSKRGILVKKIKLTDNNEEVDCRIDGSNIV